MSDDRTLRERVAELELRLNARDEEIEGVRRKLRERIDLLETRLNAVYDHLLVVHDDKRKPL